MKTEDILKIESIDSVDFAAKCTTQWHAFGVLAFLNSLGNEYNIKNGIIAILKRNGRKLIDDTNFNSSIDYNTTFIDLDSPFFAEKIKIVLKIILHKYNKRDKQILLLSPNDGWYTLAGILNCRKTVLVELDEGLSSYNAKSMWLKAAYREQSSLWDLLKAVIQFCVIGIIRFAVHPTVIDFKLFHEVDGKLLLNEEVRTSYMMVIGNKSANNITVPHEKYVIFMTQPLVEDNCISKESLEHFYDNLNSLFDGYKVLFKLHPRDRLSRTLIDESCLIDKWSGISAEELYLSLLNKPQWIVGFNSTALVSLSIFYGAKSIALTNLIINDISAPDMRDFFTDFNTKFSNYVYSPSSQEELLEIIK